MCFQQTLEPVSFAGVPDRERHEEAAALPWLSRSTQHLHDNAGLHVRSHRVLRIPPLRGRNHGQCYSQPQLICVGLIVPHSFVGVLHCASTCIIFTCRTFE